MTDNMTAQELAQLELLDFACEVDRDFTGFSGMLGNPEKLVFFGWEGEQISRESLLKLKPKSEELGLVVEFYVERRDETEGSCQNPCGQHYSLDSLLESEMAMVTLSLQA